MDGPVLRVVELAQGVAGPALGRMLAGFGHDVVKVEPRSGDWTRASYASTAPGAPTGSTFSVLNEAKRSVLLHPDDVGLHPDLVALLDVADVVIADFLPAEAAELGLSPDEVRTRWPGVVWVSMTTFGLNGEHADVPGGSLLAEAFGGLAHVVGHRDRHPLQLGGEQAAHSAALVGLFGLQLSLMRRGRVDDGNLVDVALVDVAAYSDWKSAVQFDTEGLVVRRPDDSGFWRILPAADGHLGMVYTSAQWKQLVDLIDDDVLRDPRLADAATRAGCTADWLPVVARWAAARTMQEGYTQAQALGLPFGKAVTVRDVDDDAQLLARGFVGGALPSVSAPWQIAGMSWTTAPAPDLGEHHTEVLDGLRTQRLRASAAGVRSTNRETDVLAGVTVLDLGTATAGPGVARLLADYGATVIKVESPGRPDPFRRWARADGAPPPDTGAIAPLFEGNNAGKSAVALDLKDPEDRAAFLKLVETADVLVENFRVGVPARLGIDLPHLLDINPSLLYLSMSSQGQEGPEARYASYGSTLDLTSGLASVTGYADEQPRWSSYEVNYPDQIAVLGGAALVAYCLNNGLVGRRIDLSQREVVTWTLADRLLDYRLAGLAAVPEGNRRGIGAPHGSFPTAEDDGWVALSCRTDAERMALCKVVPGLPDDADIVAWRERWDEVDATVRAWTSVQPTAAVVKQLRAAGVACVPHLDSAQRAQQQRFLERQVFVQSPYGHVTKGYPMVLREGPQPRIRRGAPTAGQDDAELLGR
jgi:crotonobetainyl-CoA:carnitine CoA-transferase CaiB-like acyl-CoA transferase